MATITSTLKLASLSYTDILSITVAPTLNVTDPTKSGTITTITTTDQEIVDRAHAKDTYVFVRNTGSTSTGGNILVTDDDGTPNSIVLLKPNDFAFLPVKAGVGMRLKYDTAATSVEWHYWTRE